MSHKIVLKIETQEDSRTTVALTPKTEITQVSWSSNLVELGGILRWSCPTLLFSR